MSIFFKRVPSSQNFHGRGLGPKNTVGSAPVLIFSFLDPEGLLPCWVRGLKHAPCGVKIGLHVESKSGNESPLSDFVVRPIPPGGTPRGCWHVCWASFQVLTTHTSMQRFRKTNFRKTHSERPRLECDTHQGKKTTFPKKKFRFDFFWTRGGVSRFAFLAPKNHIVLLFGNRISQ